MGYPFKVTKCPICGTKVFMPRGSVDFLHKCYEDYKPKNAEVKVEDRVQIKLDDPNWNFKGNDQHPFKRPDSDKKDSVFVSNFRKRIELKEPAC